MYITEDADKVRNVVPAVRHLDDSPGLREEPESHPLNLVAVSFEVVLR